MQYTLISKPFWLSKHAPVWWICDVKSCFIFQEKQRNIEKIIASTSISRRKASEGSSPSVPGVIRLDNDFATADTSPTSTYLFQPSLILCAAIFVIGSAASQWWCIVGTVKWCTRANELTKKRRGQLELMCTGLSPNRQMLHGWFDCTAFDQHRRLIIQTPCTCDKCDCHWAMMYVTMKRAT